MIFAHPRPVNVTHLVNAKKSLENIASNLVGMPAFDKHSNASERPPYPPQAPSPSTLPNPCQWLSRAVAPGHTNDTLDLQSVSECKVQATSGTAEDDQVDFRQALGLPPLGGRRFNIPPPPSPYIDTFRPFSPEALRSPESDRASTYYSANSSFGDDIVNNSPDHSLRSFLDLSPKPASPEPVNPPIFKSCWNPLPIEQQRYGLRFPYNAKDVVQPPIQRPVRESLPRAEPKPFYSPIPSLNDDLSSRTSSTDSLNEPPVRVNPKPPTSYYTDPDGMTAHFAYETAAFFAAYHEEMQSQRAIEYEKKHGIPFLHWSVEADQGDLMSYLKKVMGFENDPQWAHVE